MGKRTWERGLPGRRAGCALGDAEGAVGGRLLLDEAVDGGGLARARAGNVCAAIADDVCGRARHGSWCFPSCESEEVV